MEKYKKTLKDVKPGDVLYVIDGKWFYVYEATVKEIEHHDWGDHITIIFEKFIEPMPVQKPEQEQSWCCYEYSDTAAAIYKDDAENCVKMFIDKKIKKIHEHIEYENKKIEELNEKKTNIWERFKIV